MQPDSIEVKPLLVFEHQPLWGGGGLLTSDRVLRRVRKFLVRTRLRLLNQSVTWQDSGTKSR